MLVQECHYTNVDEHIIDALIFGSSDPRVQSKLLEYDVTLTLNKTIDIARTAEATTSQLADIKTRSIIGSIILFRQKWCKFTHFLKKTHKSEKYS